MSLFAILLMAVLLGGLVPGQNAVTVTAPYSARGVALADLDGNPATGDWSEAATATVPLETGETGDYGTATMAIKHDGTYLYVRVTGKIDVPWTSVTGDHFWFGFMLSPPTTTGHHRAGQDDVFFGEDAYTPAPTYPPRAVDTNGGGKPPAKDTVQNVDGAMGYTGTAAPYTYTAEWRRPLNSGDAQDVALLADGSTAYSFYLSTDSDGGGSGGGAIDHSAVSHDNVLYLGRQPVADVHDVAVTTASASPTAVLAGGLVTVSATAANQGNVPETFDVKAYASAINLGTKRVTALAAGGTTAVSWTWDTTGVAAGGYSIRAEAVAVAGETDLADNSYTDGTVTVSAVVHDVAITAAAASPLSGTVGVAVTISATTANQGTQAETFDVKAYAGTILVGTQPVASLAVGGTRDLTFSWDTSGALAGSHEIRVEAVTLAGETDLADNIRTDGTVVLSAPVLHALLRVETSIDTHPTWGVPTQILVDGIPRDEWSLTWVKIPAGPHTVSFTDVANLETPVDVSINPAAGETAVVSAMFKAKGWLRVVTNPPVPGTISVDGYPMNDWGVWIAVRPGTYTVSFGAVKDYRAPGPQTVVVHAEQLTTVTGEYAWDGTSPGPDPATYGLLRVTTRLSDGTPGVMTQILVDGVARDEWGLSWVKMPIGSHTLSFTDVWNFGTPADQTFTIAAGQTTTLEGVFRVHGWLRVTTSPPVPGTISVDGVPRNDWGMWMAIAPGTYTVSFGAVPGYAAPAPVTVRVDANVLSLVGGVYTPAA